MSLIRKVWQIKANGQKLVTIPKKAEEIQPGDYVEVILLRKGENDSKS